MPMILVAILTDLEGSDTMSRKPFDDSPPMTDRVNAYDEAHLADYLRLLDADEEDADWQLAMKIIFEFDVEADPERAKRIHESHLARAKWMTEIGYLHLLQPRMQ